MEFKLLKFSVGMFYGTRGEFSPRIFNQGARILNLVVVLRSDTNVVIP